MKCYGIIRFDSSLIRYMHRWVRQWPRLQRVTSSPWLWTDYRIHNDRCIDLYIFWRILAFIFIKSGFGETSILIISCTLLRISHWVSHYITIRIKTFIKKIAFKKLTIYIGETTKQNKMNSSIFSLMDLSFFSKSCNFFRIHSKVIEFLMCDLKKMCC